MGAIKCIKYLLFSFNFVFWLAGLAALGVGIWMYIDPGSYNDFFGKYSFQVPAAILMGAGAFVMLTGFCGCAGAIKESKCLLGTFFTMLLLIFCAEIAAGVLGFLFRDRIKEEVTQKSEEIIKTKFGTGDHELDAVVNKMQKNFKCCGAKKPTDYETSEWRTRSKFTSLKTVPQSCCSDNACMAAGVAVVTTTYNTYTEGCVDKLEKFALDHMLYIGAIAIGIGCIQLLGMIFACCLFFSIDDY